ncbi:MAG: exonuclease domain-containing protein, partial [Terriglobales bacterium]
MIEFGLVTIDLRTMQVVRRISIPVVPVAKVSAYCTALTGWTDAKLRKQGVSLAAACHRLEKLGVKNRLCVTDSADELVTVRAQCERLGIESPFGHESLNIAAVFALFTQQTRNLSLTEMLAHLGLTFEGRLHSGVDDAFNIGRLFIKLVELGRLSVANFAACHGGGAGG